MRLHTCLALLLCLSLPLPSAAANVANITINPTDRELLMAVGLGQVARTKALLKAGANVNTPHPPWQLTPLLVASELDFDMVKLLVNHGAKVNVSDRDGITPLMRAVTLRDLRMVQLLLDAGAQINVKDNRGHTALTHAVLRSDAAILKLLIDRGAGVDVVAAIGTTPWSIAQSMRDAALAMPEQNEEKPHVHIAGQASHPMRNKKESLIQTQEVLDVLTATGVHRPQQSVSFDAMQYHRH